MAKAILVQTGGQPDTDELTAVTGDVAKGKTAYVNGYDDPIAGTLELTGNASDEKVRSGYTYYSNDLKTKRTGTLDIPAEKIIAKQSIDGVAGTATNDANLPANRVISGFHGWAKGDHIRGTLTVTSVINFNMSAYSTSQVVANWQNPTSGLFGGVQIVSRTDGRYPNNPWDGDNRYKGTGNNTSGGGWSSTTIGGLNAGQGYWFSIFSYCNTSDGQWWSGSYNKRDYYCAPTSHGSRTFTSSGTFTVPGNVRTVDVFAVGGGATGQEGYKRSTDWAGGGGGAGYTATKKAIAVVPGKTFTISIGAGGPRINDGYSPRPGGNTSISYNGNTILTAAGGEYSSDRTIGGSGGSDGGNGGYADRDTIIHGEPGGSNGSPGQGTTTRAFGEASGTLYAGGGGGGNDYLYGSKHGAGGAGGGGRGADASDNAEGGAYGTGGGGGGGASWGHSANPGGSGGAAGGSGVAIIRW